MNVRVVRLVKYLTVAVTVYFVFHYQDVSLRTAAEGSTRHSKLIKSRRDVVKRQDLKVPETTIPPQYSSMSTTLTSTVSSAFSYSDEELEEEPQGKNMTDLDVSKETAENLTAITLLLHEGSAQDVIEAMLDGIAGQQKGR